MATVKEYISRGRKKKIPIFVNIYVVTFLIWALQCFNNNCFTNNSCEDNGSYCNTEGTLPKGVKRRSLGQRGSLFGPEMEILGDTVVNYLLRDIKGNRNDNKNERKPEVVEPEYDPPHRENPHRNHYDNNNEKSNCETPEVMSYYIPGGTSDRNQMMQRTYYPPPGVPRGMGYSVPRDKSMIGYLRRFLLQQELFASPLLNKMAPIILLMFLYYVIQATIGSFRHLIAIYFVAKVLRMLYNNSDSS